MAGGESKSGFEEAETDRIEAEKKFGRSLEILNRSD
jgi:hypothetical protein